MTTFIFNPPGLAVKIIGMDCGMHGRSCYAHNFCGSLLAEDVVVHFQRRQILIEGKEKSGIAAYHVSDRINSCCVGFLKSELTQFSSLYKGVLAQVTSKILWSKKFIECQGFKAEVNVIYQDNTSTMKLAQKGKQTLKNEPSNLI